MGGGGYPAEKEQDSPDMEYELMAYSREKIDYDYIVSLIQPVVSAPEAETIPGLNNIKETADYPGYVRTHGKIAKFKYNQSVKNALSTMLREEVLPLRFEGYQYQAPPKAQLYEFPSWTTPLSNAADGPRDYNI